MNKHSKSPSDTEKMDIKEAKEAVSDYAYDRMYEATLIELANRRIAHKFGTDGIRLPDSMYQAADHMAEAFIRLLEDRAEDEQGRPGTCYVTEKENDV